VDSEETRINGGQTDSDETRNVVRIPRDWFGPKEDLVPFGPAAWSAPGHQAETPPDAEAFWGEDADSVHEVLEPVVVGKRSAGGRARRSLVSAVLVLVMAGAGLTAWLLASPQRRAAHPQIASVRNALGALAGRLGKQAAVAEYRARPPIRSHPRAVNHRSVTARIARATQVVYRLVAPTYSQPTYSASASSGSAAAASAERVQSSAASSSAAAPATSSSRVSQPAFGANGALGPMSSPAG
jgi:hypothetical protein